MNKQAGSLVLAWLLAGAAGVQAQETGKTAAQPTPVAFYRKYLVPGNRLDDQILEQERRVEASPNDASLRNDFGNLLAQRHFPKEAAQQYEIASKLDKTDFISYYNLGLLRETEGKFSQAISAYQKSISRKRGFPQAHFRLGHLYELSGRGDAAVEEYALAMRIDPAMRDPRRNPLVVDSVLIYQASLEDYRRDLAVASLEKESLFVEENRFRAMPVDRALSSQEAAGPEEAESSAESRQVGAADAVGAGGGAQGSGGTTGPGGTRRAPRATTSENPNPMSPLGRPRPTPGPRTKVTHPAPVVPTGGAAPNAPPAPPPAVAPPPSEPETPPESMPEPTPAAPDEVEPS